MITLKTMRGDDRYTKCFMTHGNKKLTNYADAESGVKYFYNQYNLPAKTTCPFASAGCKKFCYAKRDERYPNVVNGRKASLELSKADNFVERMIYTIETELKSRRYANGKNVMIVRIHESGDFYNPEYLAKWIEVFKHFTGNKQIVFQFYTKCFKYFLDLSTDKKAALNKALENNNIGFSLSRDDSMDGKQLARLAACKMIFPLANVYYCTDKDKSGIAFDHECTCSNCGDCKKCVYTNGTFTYVAIH